MNKNFIALQAMAATQLEVLKGDKAKIVKTVAAGVLAAAMGVPGVANAQEQQAESNFGKTTVGASIGGVAGWGVAKIFGAGVATRNVLAGIGAVAGGVIANQNAEAKDATVAHSQAGFQPLGGDRAQRLSQLQRDALNARIDYQIAFRQAQVAKADTVLDPGSVIADQKYKRVAMAMVQASRHDAEAVRGFVAAFEALAGARFDVSGYASTYSKLKQPFSVNDQSYVQLAERVAKQASVEVGAASEAKVGDASVADPSRGGFAP